MRNSSAVARLYIKAAARVRHITRSFSADTKGIAAVEFALILPIMAVLMIGTIEMSQAVTIDRRVSQVGGTVGDLTARWEQTTITPTTISNLMQIGKWLLKPFPENVVRMDVSMVNVSCSGACPTPVPVNYSGQRTRWRCTYNAASATNATCACEDTQYTAPQVGLVDGLSPALIVTEVQYDYTPTFFDVFMAAANNRAAGTYSAYTLSERYTHKPRGAVFKLIDATSGTDNDHCER